MEVPMQKKDLLARLLALIGTVLVWLPIAVMVISSILGLIRSGMLNMDYLLLQRWHLYPSSAACSSGGQR